MEAGGGAWCPREMVYREGLQYLEVNLGALHVVTKVEVQGRFGNGQGREFATQYKLQIWRPNMAHWTTYNDGRGEEVRVSLLCCVFIVGRSVAGSCGVDIMGT